jgi:hypothetical protein
VGAVAVAAIALTHEEFERGFYNHPLGIITATSLILGIVFYVIGVCTGVFEGKFSNKLPDFQNPPPSPDLSVILPTDSFYSLHDMGTVAAPSFDYATLYPTIHGSARMSMGPIIAELSKTGRHFKSPFITTYPPSLEQDATIINALEAVGKVVTNISYNTDNEQTHYDFTDIELFERKFKFI